jgi:hypothetical protein
MAGLARKTAQLFAGGLPAAGNLAVWGSLKGGAASYSNDPAAIQSAAWAEGLVGAVIGNRSPSIEDLDALFYVITYQLQYLLTRGLAEYDPNTTYDHFDMCRVGPTIYYSNVDNNTGNAPPSAQWTNLLTGSSAPNLAVAWVVFSGTQVGGGGACQVFNGYNVASVTKLGTGSYQVNFASPLPSSNYAVAGMCGVANGATADPGSNNLVIGAPNGSTGIRNQNACQICSREPTQSPGLEDCGYISVIFFGS